MFGVFAWSLYARNWWGLTAAPVLEYGLSWTGHFLVEGNKPMALAQPSYSFVGSPRLLLGGSSVTDAARSSFRHGYYCFRRQSADGMGDALWQARFVISFTSDLLRSLSQTSIDHGGGYRRTALSAQPNRGC